MTIKPTTVQRILGAAAFVSVFLLIFFILTRGNEDVLTVGVMAVTGLLLLAYTVISAPDWREWLIVVSDVPDNNRPISMAFAALILNVVDRILIRFPRSKTKKD